MILVPLLLAGASVSTGTELAPASEDAIVAGVGACLKSIGPSADPEALRGWAQAPRSSFKTNGRALQRDNVLIAVNAGPRGACMILAKGDGEFSGAKLLHDLDLRFGAHLQSDAPPVLRLPDGRLMRLNVGAKNGSATYIQLAIASPKGK